MEGFYTYLNARTDECRVALMATFVVSSPESTEPTRPVTMSLCACPENELNMVGL